MKQENVKKWRQQRRARRGRAKLYGTGGQPRLAVTRHNKSIYAQVIDDDAGRTLCGVGSHSKELREQIGYGGNAKAAAVVGKALGEKAKALGIEAVCFDRRGNRYHGRVKALADAAREAGLKF